MVRQASCDVSDRNDKGSPDTVWQILGFCRASFSCSTATAAQTKIQHWLQEEKHSSVNRDASAKPSKGAQPLPLPESTQICVPAHGRAGHVGSSETPGRQRGPEPHPHLPHQPCRGALIHPARPSRAQRATGLIWPLLLVLIPKGGKAHSANLGHMKQPALHVGAFKAPGASRQGEATAQNALFLLPKLRAFIHIPLSNCSGQK